MVSPGTRATPRRSTGRRSGAWGQAPSIGRRGRPFEASRQTRARARRGESGGRAHEAPWLRGGRGRLHGPAGRERPHLPSRRGGGGLSGAKEKGRRPSGAPRGRGGRATPGASAGTARREGRVRVG